MLQLWNLKLYHEITLFKRSKVASSFTKIKLIKISPLKIIFIYCRSVANIGEALYMQLMQHRSSKLAVIWYLKIHTTATLTRGDAKTPILKKMTTPHSSKQLWYELILTAYRNYLVSVEESCFIIFLKLAAWSHQGFRLYQIQVQLKFIALLEMGYKVKSHKQKIISAVLIEDTNSFRIKYLEFWFFVYYVQMLKEIKK